MEATELETARTAKVEFTGNTGDYFKIWIVNTALTIVTLGIYSAWAKVRKLRYFYANTSIEGGHFDFHAKPVGILIGRAIAVGFLALYFLSGYVSPFAPMIVAAIVLLLIPWLVVRSRIFRLRNTSLHGLRFNFQRNYTDAAKAYYGGALFTAITFGLGTPTAIYWRNRFAVVNSGYGAEPFRFEGEYWEFYKIIYKAVGLAFLGGLVAICLSSFVTPMLPTIDLDPNDPNATVPLWFTIVTTGPILLIYFLIWVYVQVRLRNYIWNNSQIGNNRFVSSLSAVEMAGLYLTNLLAIVASVGLMIPWAQIRLARYRAFCTRLVLEDDWDQFKAGSRDGGSALGDEMGEAFDVDVDFAI